jgi:hypothetical protein
MHNALKSIKYGQSLFQDTFFVANSQLTPYRKLRQLELELHELDTSIKKTNFNLRRQAIKKREYERILSKPQSEVTENKELVEIDLEELLLGIEQTQRLLEDAQHRRDNFLKIREQLLESVPPEYWEQGFENAELENWTKHFAKQLAISMVTGVPNVGLIEQMASLPVEMTKQIMLEAKAGSQQFLLLDKQTTETPQ